MIKSKGITSGTYLTKRIRDKKNKKFSKKEICNRCKHKNICKYKEISKFKNGEVFENTVTCEDFYITITSKAILNIGRDTTTGKALTKTFTAKTEEEAYSQALAEKLEMQKKGGRKIITKSNKTLIDLVKSVLNEDFRLGEIIDSTYKRKNDTLKQIEQVAFSHKPIARVTRNEVVAYLESLKKYSKSTIKQNYELICMAFGQAHYDHIITENFMQGYNRVEKPKSEYQSHHRKALTINEQKLLVDYLKSISCKNCYNKDLFLLLLTTGIRIGEALVLDYEKDIDLKKGKIYIRRTQTKDTNGKIKIGKTTKTDNSYRILTLNNISKKFLQDAFDHKTPNKNHFLFAKKDGTMYTENSINSALKRIALKLEIGIYEDYNKKGELVKKTDIHTHMLRGTFATRCAEAKIAPAVLQKILGHKDISVTMQYYVDVDAEFEKSENQTLEDYLMNHNIFGVGFDVAV